MSDDRNFALEYRQEKQRKDQAEELAREMEQRTSTTATPLQDRDKLARDRADWLLDAIACATQDRRFLRGDPEYDAVAGEAILLNGKKAILTALTPREELEVERVPSEPGSRASTEPQSSQGLGPSGFDPSRKGPTFEQCAAVVARYIADNEWAQARGCAAANQRAHGFCEFKLLDRAKELAARDGDRFTDASGAYEVVAEMLEYFDSYRLASWAPLASIILRERARDSDRSPEGGDAEGGSVEDESAGRRHRPDTVAHPREEIGEETSYGPDFHSVLAAMKKAMHSHPFWRKVVGTPAENDLPVRAANVAVQMLRGSAAWALLNSSRPTVLKEPDA